MSLHLQRRDWCQIRLFNVSVPGDHLTIFFGINPDIVKLITLYAAYNFRLERSDNLGLGYS